MKKLFYFIYILSFLFLTLILGVVWKMGLLDLSSSLPQEEKIKKDLVEDLGKVADTKTYTNEKYHFQLEYPDFWYAIENAPENILFSNYMKAGVNWTPEEPADMFLLSVTVADTQGAVKSLEEYTLRDELGEIGKGKREYVMVNGERALHIELNNDAQRGSGEIYVFQKDAVFINLFVGEKTYTRAKVITDDIIQSFAFTPYVQ